ncbi:MAG: PEGA domain-containing protein [Nitrospira sp.]|nr:PEGA domain-containing protein [Nitrospira sp.]
MQFRLSILVLAMVTSGCATIIDGSSQPVTFNSSPNGARIYVNGMELGTTPLTMPVKRSKSMMILAKKNGYEDQQLVLQTKTNSWFWGNILLGGLYGSTTDYASDAMIEYSPNMYYITLNPIPPMQSNEGGFALESGTRTRIEHESIRTERQVRNFILHNHAYLTTDISRGQGEYLSSLYTMLQLPESGETLKRIRGLSARNQEAPSFAEAVLSQYPADNQAAPPQGQKTNRSRR